MPTFVLRLVLSTTSSSTVLASPLPFSYYIPPHPSAIRSAPLSAIANTTTCGCAAILTGSTLASHTLSPLNVLDPQPRVHSSPHTTRARGAVEPVRGAANPHIDLLVRAGDGKRRIARRRGLGRDHGGHMQRGHGGEDLAVGCARGRRSRQLRCQTWKIHESDAADMAGRLESVWR